MSVAYVNSDGKLDDNNIYGFDIDEDMVKLATLNMLLNGDGNAKIEARAGNGSIDTKFADNGELITLVPSTNRAGKDGEPIDWDRRPDDHIPFPRFPADKQQEISLLYHNPKAVYNPSKCSLGDFLSYDDKFNETAGIYELDKSAKLLKAKLNQTIENIIDDIPVIPDFTL